VARSSTEPDPAAPATLEDAERETIICALRRTGGVIGGPNGAAAQLGLKRTTLNFKMRKLGITRDLCFAKTASGAFQNDAGMAEANATRRRFLKAS